MSSFVKINNFKIGPEYPCFIIAEAGVNHNGDVQLAHELIDAAKQCGADAVKFQAFRTEDLVTPQSRKAEYQVKTTGGDNSQFSMLKQLELSMDEQAGLKKHCDEAGILYLCTPYDEKSAEHLARVGVDAYKIASTDTSNLPFLRRLSAKNIPVFLSTGMSTLGDVELSVNELKAGGLEGKIIILQCTSEYPVPFKDLNLKTMAVMKSAFRCPVGFSDHTPGIGASPWAVAAGACVVEKHFTLDREMEGPDHKASVNPGELAGLVQTVRNVEAALGDGIKRIMPSEGKNKSKMQKSLVVKRDIRAGEEIRAADIACKRPGTGLPPKWFDRVAGKKAAVSLKRDEILTLDSISWGN